MRALGWIVAAVVGLAPRVARAYRPFDQTDGDVAGLGEVELEVGPAQLYARDGTRQYVPEFVFNIGALHRLELVLDTQAFVPLHDAEPTSFEVGALAKVVLREGVLQEKSGPSIAVEAGALLPTLPHGNEVGGSIAGIVSVRLGGATVHANAFVADTREHELDAVLGAIVEGPAAWTVRPVGEVWIERLGDAGDASALGGALWRVREGLVFDGALRLAREEGALAAELRAGFTLSFSVFSGEPEPKEGP